MALVTPASSRGYTLHGPYHVPDGAVNAGNVEQCCCINFYSLYLSSSYVPYRTFHYFILLGQGEPDPSDYIMGAQLWTTYNGVYVWSGPQYQCGDRSTTTYFESGSENVITPVTVRFSSSSCAHFLEILSYFGATYPCDDASVKVGEVEYNLDAAGGSATVSDAMRQCPPGVTCFPAELQQPYEASKSFSFIGVAYDPLPPAPPPPPEVPSLGNTSNGYCPIGSKVNYGSGNLVDGVPLLSMKGAGPGVDLALSYNSQDNAAGSLGAGWTHSYAMRVVPSGTKYLVLAEEDGRRIVFEEGAPGAFAPLPRYGRPGTTVQRFGDGTYRMTRKDGTQYDFGSSGLLASVRDRNGNATTLSYMGSDLTQIADASGRVVSLVYDGSHRLASATDPAGRTWSFSYDAGGHLASITDPEGGVRSFGHDGSGRMVSKTDPAGHTTDYAYDASGKLESATDPTGTPALVSYSPATNRATVTGRNGGVTTTTYDPVLDAPLSVVGADNGVTTYLYDNAANTLSSTDAAENVTTYTYDGSGNRLTATDALGRTTTYAYNAFGQVTAATDPEGHVTTNSYDAAGNLLSVTDAAGAVTQYGYDAWGNLTSVTRPGGTTTFTYDAYGNVATVTDPAGLVTSLSHDIMGNLLSRTDPNGAVTSFAYDNVSRLIRVTDPLGSTTSFGYDANGNRTSVTDGNGNATLYTYTERNRPETVTDALGHTITYAYTFGGCSSCGSGGDLLAATTDANGRTTSYEYDISGRLTQATDPLGHATASAYDNVGNAISRTDALGRTTVYLPDPLGRVVSLTDPLGGIASFGYSPAGHLDNVTDTIGVSTAYAYDNTGRVIQVASPDSGVTTYVYNPDGTLATRTDGTGTVSTYSYDNAARLTRISYPDPAQDVLFAYDSPASSFGLGRLTSMTDPSGTTVYQYDALGRVVQEAKTVLGVLYTTTYAYDNVGNLTQVTYPSGRRVDHAYDALNRPISASWTKGSTNTTVASGIAYDNVGNLVTLPLGNGIVETYVYDGTDRLFELTAPGIQVAYGYDNVGNLLSMNEAPSTTRSYGYDPLDRLESATGPFGVFSFTFDSNGNRLTQGKDGATTTYDYGANRLLSSTIGGTTTYGYDGAGMIVSRGTSAYVYGPSERLVRYYEGTELKGEYVYDGKGRRVVKKTYTTVHNKTTVTTRVFHYDLSGNLLSETTDAGALVADYVLLGSRPLAIVKKSGSKEATYWYRVDHLGTPRAITDKNGAVVWQVEFDPYGNETGVPIKIVENNLRFPGQYFDAEAGLHYNYFRDYDPRTGRYIEPDPVGLEGGMNRYLYTENNPIRYTDPKGLMRFPFLPPNGCEYYKKKCEENTCGSEKDDYACKAYSCCKTFGDNPTGNCIRGCLIEFDKRNCARLSGEERNRCRRLAHWDCYDRCLGHAMGGEGLLFGPPKECIDAMNAVGGMGF